MQQDITGFGDQGWDFCPVLHCHCVMMLDLKLSSTWLPALCSCHSASWYLIWQWARGTSPFHEVYTETQHCVTAGL